MAAPITVYHYPFSPYGRRITWYLALRGMPYSECEQPAWMPRPDLKMIGVEYRRIPVVAIGRDVYLDTRLQLPKLESLGVPQARLGGTTPEQRAFERLLSAYVNDRGMFGAMALLLPEDLPMMNDPNFLKDRDDFFASPNYKWDAQSRKEQRPASLRKLADMFILLEGTLLADSRTWILDTPQPSLADIEAVWLLNFILEIPGALPEAQFSAKTYPQVFAWIDRFRAALDKAKAKNSPRSLSGAQAAAEITRAAWNEATGAVDTHDFEVAALGLAKGDMVTVGPTDFGSSCRDAGALVSVSSQEVVIEAEAGQSTVRIHAPRQQFSIEKS
ncbi:hypothetical protein V2A60_006859 [Cordyceps javanica]